jgi:hypothetical protein
MRNAVKQLVCIGTICSLVACGGGGGGGGSTSTGGTYYTHDQLAAEFVRRVNSDVTGFDLQLVKSNTNQTSYIVVYDRDYLSYDAYYIGAYNVGENMGNYLRSYENRFYYDLDVVGSNLYKDYSSGLYFSKAEAVGKNLSVMKALREELVIKKAATNLRVNYGLSEEKAFDTARFSYKIKTSAPGTYRASDFDAFAKELSGSSITEFQNDVKSGNVLSLNDRLKKASEVTGMGSEGVNKLIKDLFMGQP